MAIREICPQGTIFLPSGFHLVTVDMIIHHRLLCETIADLPLLGNIGTMLLLLALVFVSTTIFVGALRLRMTGIDFLLPTSGVAFLLGRTQLIAVTLLRLKSMIATIEDLLIGILRILSHLAQGPVVLESETITTEYLLGKNTTCHRA